MEAVKSLKEQNAPIVRAYVGAVIVALIAYSSSESGFDLSRVLQGEFGTMPLENLPGFALASLAYILIARLLPTSVKEALVYWRWKERLPANRAFSVIARSDPRVNVSVLQGKHGPFPKRGDRQNSLWYQIYRIHQNEPGVIDSNKHYLLYRDLGAANFLLAVILLPILLAFGSLNVASTFIAAAVLVAVGVFLALNARSSGVRLVQNVLAVESAELSNTGLFGRIEA